MGRKIDFSFLENEGFQIGNKIKKMTWGFLYSLDVPTHPGFMREFYNALGQVANGFICTVKEKILHITKDLLERLLQISTQGLVAIRHSDRGATLRLIFGRKDINPLEKIPVSQLLAEMRLLHSIISHILFSRMDRFDFLLDRDLIFMHCTIEEISINLS